MTSLGKIPKCKRPFEVLTVPSLESIHSSSLQILEEVGVEFHDERTLKLLAGKSCEVDPARDRVRMTGNLVDECVRKVPRSFNLYSRRLDEMKIGGDNMYFVSAIDNSHILDTELGQRRSGKLSDVGETAKLMDELFFHHICCPGVIAHDIDPRLRTLYAAAKLLQNTQKHCIVCPTNGLEAKYFIRMGAALAGSEDELQAKPIVSTAIAATSPLVFPKSSCEVLWEFAERRLPFVIIQAPIAGATSPVTMAGAMAVANAENLAGIVLSQLISEGTPIVYGGAISNLDMRYAWPAYGGIEYGLFTIATAQMGRFYDLPSYGAGGATNANLSDAQSGYEKMSSSLLAYLAGHDMMCDASLSANALTSFDSIVIQDEILAMLARLGRGFEVTGETIAFDIVKKVGPGGNFLGEKHTRDTFKADFYYSELSNRRSYQNWISKGGLDLHTVALARARKLIEQHKTSRNADEDRQMDEILSEARKELAV